MQKLQEMAWNAKKHRELREIVNAGNRGNAWNAGNVRTAGNSGKQENSGI